MTYSESFEDCQGCTHLSLWEGNCNNLVYWELRPGLVISLFFINHVSNSGYFLMVTKSVLDNLLMCAVDLSSLSVIKPKSHTVSTQVMLSFPIFTVVFYASAFSRVCLLTTMITSILLSFNFKRFQSLISCMQFCRLVRYVSLFPSMAGAKLRYSCWSSALLWYSMLCFLQISPKGDMYSVNSISPRTDPWGLHIWRLLSQIGPDFVHHLGPLSVFILWGNL